MKSRFDVLETAMTGFNLTIIASVRPPQTPEETPACQNRLDRLEADFMHRLRSLKENGGGMTTSGGGGREGGDQVIVAIVTVTMSGRLRTFSPPGCKM